MPIKIECSGCGVELNKPSALLFTAPNEQNEVIKIHLCTVCTEIVIELLKQQQPRHL